MARKNGELQDEESRLRKKIDDYNKYQWLVFIPVWAAAIWNITGHEAFGWLIDIGALLFSVIAIVAIRLQVRKWRAALARLEKRGNYIPKRFKTPRWGG